MNPSRPGPSHHWVYLHVIQRLERLLLLLRGTPVPRPAFHLTPSAGRTRVVSGGGEKTLPTGPTAAGRDQNMC